MRPDGLLHRAGRLSIMGGSEYGTADQKETAIMSGREAKFCLDRNQVRWVLLEGVINRKTPQDDPDKGMNLPVEKIQSIEKTQIVRRHQNPLAAPATLAGVLFLALSGW